MKLKRLISLLLMTAILLSGFGVYAYDFAKNEYFLDFSYIKEGVGYTYGGKALKISSGGNVVFSDELLFTASSVTAYGTGTIKLVCGSESVNIALNPKDGGMAEFTTPVHKETKDITVYAVSDCEITNIVFNRLDLDFPLDKNLAVPDMPAEEMNILSAFVVKQGLNAYLSHGAVRYVDYNDTHSFVTNIDGKMYVPAQAFASGLHLYWEIIPEKHYILMRKDNESELLLSDDVSYFKNSREEKTQLSNPVVYINNTPFIPLRDVAELFGKYVYYKDGYVAVDTYKKATYILNDGATFSFIKKKLDGFNPNYTGNTYYVAQTQNASDSNDGSEGAPFKTISMAANTAKAGDTVIICEGTYRETLKPKNSGNSSAPITFKAREGDSVTISALEELTSFADYTLPNGTKGAIAMMKTTLPQGKNQIFYKGEALGEGRHPNEHTADPDKCKALNLSEMWFTFGDITLREYTDEENALKSKPVIYELVSKNDLNQPDGYWDGSTYVGLQGAAWSTSTGRIERSVTGKLYVDKNKVTKTWWFGKKSAGNFGYITNHINTVDKPREWFVDDNENILYICLPEGETSSTFRAEYKARQLVCDLRGKDNIILEGIHTIGGGITMHDGDMNVINNCNIEYISHHTYSDDQRDGFIDNKNLRTAEGAPAKGESGIYIDGESCVIANSRINHSAQAGIYSAGSYSVYENNYITDCGYMGSYTAGITMEAPGWITGQDYKHGGEYIYKNTIRRAGRACLSVATVVDNLANYATVLPFDICYNDISDGMISGGDGGTIYEHGVNVGTDVQRAKLHHNSIMNQWEQHHYPRGGLYHDNCVVYQESYDNMIYYNNGIGMSPKIYTQNRAAFPTTYAVTYEWGNNTFDNFDSLTLSEIPYTSYPGGRAYMLGSSLEKGEFTYNYENRNASGSWTGAKGSIEKDGYVTFENVDFGDGNNVIELYFCGDKYKPVEKIDVTVGDSIENGQTIRTTLVPTATELNYCESTSFVVGGYTGVKNVYIKPVEDYGAEPLKLRTYRDDEKRLSVEKLYGGAYSELTPGDPEQLPVHKYLSSDTRNSYINNTWKGTILKYSQVELTADFDSFVYSAGTGAPWSGNSVTVYFDSLDSEPVGQFTITTEDWSDFSEKVVPLNKTVKAGTHDIYIMFGNEGKSCDWYYIGFSKGN